MRFTDLEMRYTGPHDDGHRPPGHSQQRRSTSLRSPRRPTPESNILAAPNGAMTLTGVAVTTHQISVSLPIR